MTKRFRVFVFRLAVYFVHFIFFFQQLLDVFEKENIPILQMSTATLEGVMELRNEV